MGKPKQKKVDKSLDMTFPASDPPASGQATGTEPPARPASRQAPVISKEEIDSAAGTQEPEQKRTRGRKRRHGVDREGLRQDDPVDEIVDQEGLNREGLERER
jgi:hypothetical protein